MVREYKAGKYRKVVCSICKTKIKTGENYYTTGRTNESHSRLYSKNEGALKRKPLTIYCSDCIEGIYVDGSKNKTMELLEVI